MRVSALCAECVVNGPHVQACSHWSSADLSREYKAHTMWLKTATHLVMGDKANSFKTLEETPWWYSNEIVKWSVSLYRFIWQLGCLGLYSNALHGFHQLMTSMCFSTFEPECFLWRPYPTQRPQGNSCCFLHLPQIMICP